MGLELLLPVILFLITLVIIYLLRVEDKRDRRLDLMKQKVSMFSKEVESARSQFKDTVQQAEERINHKIEASNQMLLRIDGQLTDLEVRSDDLAKLQGVLTAYRDSLTKLGASTAQVETRIEQLKEEVHRIEAVQMVIDGFDARIKDFGHALEGMVAQSSDAIAQQQQRVKQLLDGSYAKLQEYEQEVQEVERANQARVASHAEQLKSHEAASLAVLSNQLVKIRQLGDDSEQVITSSQRALEHLREQSFQDVNEQKKSFDSLKVELETSIAEQKQALEKLQESVENRSAEAMHAYHESCNAKMESLFEKTLNRTDKAFQTMVQTVSAFIQELDDRMRQAQQLEKHRLHTQQQTLEDYAKEIQILVEKHTQAVEQIRLQQRKQEEMQQVIAHLKQEATALHSELSQLTQQKESLVQDTEERTSQAAALTASLALLSEQLLQKQEALQQMLPEKQAEEP
ncbi:MAG: hypothetical protein AB7C91_12550, partial [Sphaerochaeta sp.]